MTKPDFEAEARALLTVARQALKRMPSIVDQIKKHTQLCLDWMAQVGQTPDNWETTSLVRAHRHIAKIYLSQLEEQVRLARTCAELAMENGSHIRDIEGAEIREKFYKARHDIFFKSGAHFDDAFVVVQAIERAEFK